MEFGTFVLAAFAIIGVWHTVRHLAKNTRTFAWLHNWWFGLLDDPTLPRPIRKDRAATLASGGCSGNLGRVLNAMGEVRGILSVSMRTR